MKAFPEPRRRCHTISVHLIDHILEFSLSWILTQRSHDGAKLLGGDGPITILIKQGEGLLKLWTGRDKERKGDMERLKSEEIS